MSAKTSFDTLKAREEKVLCRTYGRYPLAVARAEGTRLYDYEGNEYLDLLAGIAVVNLGHCRPELTKVMCEQSARLVHVSNLFYQEPQLDLAERLLATCGLGKAFFCNSGAEANEAAIKLARRYQRKVRGRDAYEIVTFEGSFHGRTLGTLGATGQARFRDGFEPLPKGFLNVPWNDADALRAAVGGRTAAVLVEMVQGEGGVRPMTPEFAAVIQDVCRASGALFMVDEIQTGLGRSGRMWAFQHFGVGPDVVTVAKGLANGLPMGAMLCTDEAAKGFEPGTHATTFGGGGVVAAVAAKVLDILVADRLPEHAAEMGAYALETLGALRAKHPDKIADVRGLGLLVGVELTSSGQDVWRELFERRIVLNLTQGNVLRIAPPLVVSREDIDAYVTALDEVLTTL
ncbi:MAG: aspartate aminotransferase family protein [Desulfovibrionaceae bacterium]|jgi:acetylornithine aminotransferase|nr:aspartate aminotransferase family protein [Desulfovibrionaceae bacterium]